MAWWSSLNDQVKWAIEVTDDGEYKLMAVYACLGLMAFSKVRATAGNQSLIFTVQNTGSWDSRRSHVVGTLKLKAGRQTVNLQATRISNQFVMNLSEVILEKN